MLDASLESGKLSAARELCGDFLGALEDADGERDGRDRGAYRFLKAVTVLLRLKGFNSRDQMMPITEIELTGHPLLAFTPPTRAAGAPPGKPEPTVRALELAVHLARSSSSVSVVRMANCELSPDGGDKCMTEVVRLVRQVGIGNQARFLDEVDLHGNSMDAEAVRKIVEAAVKERSERPRACAGRPPLWLDLGGNRVRSPGVVFQNLQAWASWAHGCEKALCLADQEGCCRESCPSKCMLHMTGFLEQSKPEARQQLQALPAPEGSTATAAAGTGTGTSAAATAPAAPPPLLPAPPQLRPSPARKRAPEAWRPLASPHTRRRDPSRKGARAARSGGSRDRRRRRSRGRRKRSAEPPRAELQLRPGPGFAAAAPARARSGRSCSRRGRRSRSRRRKRDAAKRSRKSPVRSASASAASQDAGSAPASPGGGGAQSGSEVSASESPAAEEEEEQVEGSCSPSRSAGCGPSVSEYSYSYSEDESAAEAARPAAKGAKRGAPTAEQLGLRMNRLIESLKSSAADDETAQAPAGRRPQRREEERGRRRRH